MIWLAWRQFRLSALMMFGTLGAVVAALAITGPRLHREGAEVLATCARAGSRISPPCTDDFDHFFFAHVGAYSGLGLLVMAIPGVVGVLWGAPLISREFEAGTQDLVWQQSVPRRRWLAVKVGLIGSAAIAAAAVAVVAVSWWARPLDATAIDGLNNLTPVSFDARGIAVVGHTAFAFALGTTAGLLIRRTIPAMAVTFVVFIAAQIIMPTMVRPHLATPVRSESVITARSLTGVDASGPDGTVRGLLVTVGPPGAWILSGSTVDSAGRTVEVLPAWVAACATPEAPEGELPQQQCLDRLAAEGYRQAATYHPAERFWPLQAAETAIFGVLGLLLIGFCFRRIRSS